MATFLTNRVHASGEQYFIFVDRKEASGSLLRQSTIQNSQAPELAVYIPRGISITSTNFFFSLEFSQIVDIEFYR